MLARIPEEVDPNQAWLVKYWAENLNVSTDRIIQAVGVVGPRVDRLRKHLRDGYRIAICGRSGIAHLVARITLERGGFAVSVPYYPAKQGWLFEIPITYDHTRFSVKYSECRHFTVEDTVKLSLHMDGFVQFSTGGTNPIISGYNQQLGAIKGLGQMAPDPVHVTTGPLFGVVVQGLDCFQKLGKKPAEIFEEEDFWHHPQFSSPEHTAYHLEAFMVPRNELGDARLINGKRVLQRSLPFISIVKFPFHLRVLELPGYPFFLGLILSRMSCEMESTSCYKIFGPGCGKPGDQKKMIGARYPRLELVSQYNPISLDYRPVDKGVEPLSPLPRE